MPAKKRKAKKRNRKDDGPSLFHQIMGAVVGGSLALALYYGYEYASPQLTAWIRLPQSKYSVNTETNTAAQTGMKTEQAKRINSRTRRILAEFGRDGATQEITNEHRRFRGGRETLVEIAEKKDVTPGDARFDPDSLHGAAQNADQEDRWAEIVKRTQKILEPLDSPEEEEEEENVWEDPWDNKNKDRMVAHEGSNDDLSDSGPEHWLMALGALVGAAIIRFRKYVV